MTSVQQIMLAKATVAGTLVIAPKSVTFRRFSPGVCAFWKFAQPFLYHNILMLLRLVTVVFDGIIIFMYLRAVKSTRTKNNLGILIYLETCS